MLAERIRMWIIRDGKPGVKDQVEAVQWWIG